MALTATTFTVEVEIIGVTNIYYLSVSYIAVDPNFPHHLNSFDNVPVNVSNGALTNISVASSSPTNYLNTINYTLQAAGRTYDTFSTPLTNNKVVLFLSTLFINYDTLSMPGELVDYYVNTSVVST